MIAALVTVLFAGGFLLLGSAILRVGDDARRAAGLSPTEGSES